MQYTLHQLQILLTISETGSITRAAESLHLSQPAVSIQLRNLQDQFDIPLTEVVGRKLYLTDFGYEIVASARNILNEVEAMERTKLARQGFLTGKLKISVVSTGKYIMPYFLTDFMQQHTGVDLQMDVTNKNRVIESLESNAVDFALVSILPEHLKVEKLDLLRNKLFLVGKSIPEIYSSGPLRTWFEQLPLIFRENGSGTRQVMEGYIHRYKLQVQRKMELTSNEAVKQALLAGLGYSVMPLIGIRHELKSRSLQIIPAKGLPIQTTWQLIWLKGKRFGPAASAFIAFLEANKQSLLRKHFRDDEKY